jgi:tetratricopeptide (TPR) repeat protein
VEQKESNVIIYKTNIGNINIMESNNTREAPGSTKTPYSNNPLSPAFPVPLQMSALSNPGAGLQRIPTNQPEHPIPQFPSSASIPSITGAPLNYLLPVQGNLLSVNQPGENPLSGVNYVGSNAVGNGVESVRPVGSSVTSCTPVANSTLLNGILQPTPIPGSGVTILNSDKIFSQDSLLLSQLNSVAEFLAAKGDFVNSITYYERITMVDTENGAAWTALGHCYLLTDNLQKAFTAYQKALYTLPDVRDPQLWYGIGLLYDKVRIAVKNSLRAMSMQYQH